MNLFLLALLSSAPATNQGQEGFGIYDVNPDLTTGAMEFFREIYVDPAAFPNQVSPKVAGEGTGVLNIPNGTTAYLIVTVNDVKVGKVGPLTTAAIHDMKAGSYEVSLQQPNGFSWTTTIETSAPFDPSNGITRDPAVKPVPLPKGEGPKTPGIVTE